MNLAIELAPGADANAFAVMLTDLVRQNLESSRAKTESARKTRGSVAIIVEDAGVALTLRFEGARVTVHDGIAGIPDIAIRGDADMILGLSNLPSPTVRTFYEVLHDPRSRKPFTDLLEALVRRRLKLHGAWINPRLLLRVAHVLSVEG